MGAAASPPTRVTAPFSDTGKWDLGSLTRQLRADAAAESATTAARLGGALRKRGTTQTARLRKGIGALRAADTVTADDLAPIVESLDDIEFTLARPGQEA